MRQFLTALLAGHVPAAQMDATITALEALPPNASRAQIAAVLTTAGAPAAEVDRLSNLIELELASRRDFDFGTVVRTPALRNLVVNDPNNPVVRQADTATFGGRISRAMTTAIIACVLGTAGILGAYWANQRVDGAAEAFSKGADAFTKTQADVSALQTENNENKVRLDGHDKTIADHGSRIGQAETDIAGFNGRLASTDDKVKKLGAQTAANTKRIALLSAVQLKACIAAGTSEEDCKASLGMGKKPCAPKATAPASSAMLNIHGRDMEVVTTP